MTKYAAYDDLAIYAIGNTPDDAIATARTDTKEPNAKFNTTKISDSLAAWIDRNGWDGNTRSFDIRDGLIIDTTES